jgi:Excreted virulence factor EspC, type VII ESX diderm
MNETLAGTVSLLRRAATTVTEAGARIGGYDPGPRAFGADGPGDLGELGRQLHQRWLRALDARAREAAALGARLDDAADALVRAAASYADADHRAAAPGAT